MCTTTASIVCSKHRALPLNSLHLAFSPRISLIKIQTVLWINSIIIDTVWNNSRFILSDQSDFYIVNLPIAAQPKFIMSKIELAQSAGTVEYTDCFSTSGLDMTLNNLMVRFQQCWSFGEYGVLLYCHRSKVHSGPEW